MSVPETNGSTAARQSTVTAGGRELLWWWNGRLCPEDRVCLSPRDRGIRYGDGVYDTIRVHRGRSFRLPEHIARVGRGLELIEIDLDPRRAFPLEPLAEMVEANVGRGEGRLRLQVTRGPDSGNHLPGARPVPTVLAVAEPLPPDTPISDPGPARLTAILDPATRPRSWSSLKSLSHLSYVLAAAEARRRGADDGLLVADGEVQESTAANVFAVIDGRVHTPPEDAGILAGVTRDIIIELAAAQGYDVVQSPLALAALDDATEIFLTGSVAGIRPVAELDGRAPRGVVPGPVTRALRAAYARLIRHECGGTSDADQRNEE